MKTTISDPVDTHLVTFPEGDGRARRAMFLMRDVGDANALVPVMDVMSDERGGCWSPSALVSGLAAERFDLETAGAKHGRIPVERWENVRRPDVFVTSSSCSSAHLQVAMRAIFPDVPMIYVEDNYRQYAKLFAALRKERLRLPDFVCTIDGGSLEDLIGAYPEYDHARAFSTGQPVFARLAGESPALRQEARRALGLGDARLVVFMGGPKNGTTVPALAEALAAIGCRGPVYTVRRHPRDASSEADYAAAFDRAGLQYLQTDEHATETVAMAADLVLAKSSTEVLVAAHRMIPAAYVDDMAHAAPTDGPPPRVDAPLPPVRMGAIAHWDTVAKAAEFVRVILEPASAAEAARALSLHNRQKHFRNAYQKDAAKNIFEHIRAFVPR
ncbi:MAG: hypothetical protein QY323_01625 [Patescibacteria group bacterium]|nr:MAG: hypothetical protein QY323_01625 [Patescibacteria group bacterium]